MFNPLDEQIRLLIAEIAKDEAERDRIETQLQKDYYPLANLPVHRLESIRPSLEVLERLKVSVESKRQKLISLELQRLDDSIKDLHSATNQVDGSVKSLEATTNKVLKSSAKLESLTKLLVIVTVLLVIVAIYQAALTLSTSNPLYGAIGIIAVFGLLVYFMFMVFHWKGEGKLTKLTE